ncbi:MAG: exodeoxyribonuclease III [Coriobacteriia bacterium]|nr:exodeoxyribonuclease III [Coriobacteriia bacterium]
MTKLISWNVNGLRANLKKGFMEHFEALDADIFMLQEIKLQEGQIELELPGYFQSWSYAEKKGYSGTAVFSKREPLRVVTTLVEVVEFDHDSRTGFDTSSDDALADGANPGLDLDREGRITACEFEDFWVVNVYTPNIQPELARMDFRMRWEDAFRAFVTRLDTDKPVIIGGDLNCAHEEIDLARPKPNRGKPGFSDEERAKLSELLAAGFVDPLRLANPDVPELYTWWSYRANARANNVGWRIDYFLCSERLVPRVVDTPIYAEIHGSDHCPVGLVLNC